MFFGSTLYPIFSMALVMFCIEVFELSILCCDDVFYNHYTMLASHAFDN